MTLPMMTPPVKTFKLLITTAVVMLIAAAPVSTAQGETCFSRQHQKAMVNSRSALANPGTAMDIHIVQSERDCVLACCSEEVKPDAKCTMAVFNSNKPPNMDNCYLYHCDKEQDCPLMVAPEGINTYDIFKGVINPTIVRPASTSAEPTTTTTTTHAPTSPATTTTTPPSPTTSTATTATTVTMAPPTQPKTTAAVTLATIKATTTTTPTSASPQASTTATPTATQAANSQSQPPELATTTQARPVMVQATKPVATAPPNGTPTASATQQPPALLEGASWLTTAPAPTATTPSTPTTKKPNKTSKKLNKTTKKVKAHAVAPTTFTTNTIHTTNAPPAVMPGRKSGRRSTPKPEAAIEHLISTAPTTPTTTITTPTVVITATVTATTSVAAESYIPRRTATVLGLVEGEGRTQHDPTVPKNGVSVESIAQGNAVSRGALRSSLVALMVLGLALLTLALAVGGRKAMESFDRRHYTRLELNDLHYEV